jgi:uncharacterized protein
VRDFGTALALVFVIEGILYAVFPTPMRRMVVQLATLPTPTLRFTGLIAAGLGVIAVWLVRH